jgi:hypothetical protein
MKEEWYTRGCDVHTNAVCWTEEEEECICSLTWWWCVHQQGGSLKLLCIESYYKMMLMKSIVKGSSVHSSMLQDIGVVKTVIWFPCLCFKLYYWCADSEVSIWILVACLGGFISCNKIPNSVKHSWYDLAERLHYKLCLPVDEAQTGCSNIVSCSWEASWMTL